VDANRVITGRQGCNSWLALEWSGREDTCKAAGQEERKVDERTSPERRRERERGIKKIKK
jgi:hypothetical protein